MQERKPRTEKGRAPRKHTIPKEKPNKRGINTIPRESCPNCEKQGITRYLLHDLYYFQLQGKRYHVKPVVFCRWCSYARRNEEEIKKIPE